MIARGTFIAMGLACASVASARATGEFDPATSAASQELRVLLGRGDAASLAGGGFVFAGRTYRGTFVRRPDGSIVNTLRLEEYLYSVVSREMPASWPGAALAAQAICARTYVLQRSNPRRAYDVVPSQLDQVYDGVESETAAARTAVDATRGAALRFGSQFAEIVYSSCCGGHTEASSDAWGGAPIPYLDGVVCATCTASPYYRWSRAIEASAVERAFGTQLRACGALRGVVLGPLDPSGRARWFELQGDQGSVRIAGSPFRLGLGPRALPSLLISAMQPSAEGGAFAVQGGGLGHGVGLCQWGARGLALQGAPFGDILRFYFPGTEIDHD